MNVVLRLSLAFSGSLAVLAGCAQGSTIGTGGAGGSDGGSGSGTGSSKAATTSVGHTSAAVTTITVSSASTGEGGAGGSGPMCDFTEDNSCAAAQGMAAISGDDGGNGTVSGTGSHWVQVHMTETNSAIFSTKDLAYTVTLTSPPGMVYNLTVHEGSDGGATNCGAAPKAGTPANAAVQTVHDGWSDTQGLGGVDNSRWLSIEITYVSGMDCTGAWTLGVVGGT